jgi:hypothetical protein
MTKLSFNCYYTDIVIPFCYAEYRSCLYSTLNHIISSLNEIVMLSIVAFRGKIMGFIVEHLCALFSLPYRLRTLEPRSLMRLFDHDALPPGACTIKVFTAAIYGYP